MTTKAERERAVAITAAVVMLSFALFAIAAVRLEKKSESIMYMAVVIPSILGAITYDKLYPNGTIQST